MNIQEVLATNLRYYRKSAHLTQEQLAEKAGLHRTYIGGIEQRRVNVSLKNIEKISKALDVDPALLLMGVPGSKPFPKSPAPESGADSGNDTCALVRWSGREVFVQPLDRRYDDLTIQVLLDLIDRGYRGNTLLSAYEHARAEIRAFLQHRNQ